MRFASMFHSVASRRMPIIFAIGLAVPACSDTTTPMDQPPLPDPVASVEVSGARPLEPSETLQLSLALRAANGDFLSSRTVRWESSDSAVATVTSAGLVTAMARSGSATIRATAEGRSGSASVIVWRQYRSPVTYGLGSSTELMVLDTVRQRQLSVRVWIPAGAPQPLPVVITGVERWAAAFLSAGYAVIRIGGPPTDARMCVEFGVPESECAAVLANQGGPDGSAISTLAIARDASTVMNQLALVARAAGAALDPDRVGFSGVSRGAVAALALAGATIDLSPGARTVSVRDARFAAYAAHSPGGTTSTRPFCGCGVSSWPTTSGSVLVQTSTGDEWGRRESFDHMLAGDKYLAFYNAATITHIAFTLEFGLIAPPGPLAQYISMVGVAFFDAYLHGSAEARDWLRTNELGRGTEAGVQVSTK